MDGSFISSPLGLIDSLYQWLLVTGVYFLGFHHPPPSTSSFPRYCPAGISASVQLANDYWQNFYPSPPPGPNSLTWGNGTYFSGDLVAPGGTSSQRYRDYALRWAISNNFSLDAHPTNPADYLSVGNAYITLYLLDPTHPPHYITAIDTEISKIVNSTKVDLWTWVDALYMSMPQFTLLSVIRNDSQYLDRMYELFNHTKTVEGGLGLWDSSKGLWWRDRGFVGTNVYWSRGNGWAIAALAKVLDVLPKSDPHYDEYSTTLQQMGSSIAALQQRDGFWYVNLGNSSDFPGPETSGTSLFIYGLTWGINNGFFDAAKYGPIVSRAWKAVVSTALAPNGFLGYVQGPGFKPSSKQPVNSTSTADFGVGAFLLAGSELVKLCGDY
ncbi:hypothetical protein TWF694_007229 [Orbilia ellipsospora]|uniref:Glycoside hydrolase family 88 protein n=1 Tax=Orbilia ellipsospora TaxID=2528407 RepID=A0AAV9XH40_9PEZI